MASERLQKLLQKADEKEQDRLRQESPMTMENFLLRLNDVSDRREFMAFEKTVEYVLNEAVKLDKLLASLSKQRVAIGRIVEDLTKLQKWYKDLIVPFWEKLPDVSMDDQGSSGTDTNGSATSSMGTTPTASAISSGSAAVNSASAMATAVANREQALASLRQVANFFRTTEPHSPVSYALEQAVRWGRMPLPALLKEIVEDQGTLAGLFQRLGIQEKSDAQENNDN